MSRDLSWRVEEVCFNAFPSLKQVLLGDWLLRFSKGVSRRGNSANPLTGCCAEVAAIIPICERLYRAQAQATIFRVPSMADPALDRQLAARGYTSEGETCVLYGDMAALGVETDARVQLLPEPVEEWLAAMAMLQGFSAPHRATYAGVVGAIAVPARFAILRIGDAPAALAYGALHDGMLCYESVITAANQRRQGLGRAVIATLAAWAAAEGAEAACLQVQADNTPAIALYRDFGLSRELHRYHYRRDN